MPKGNGARDGEMRTYAEAAWPVGRRPERAARRRRGSWTWARRESERDLEERTKERVRLSAVGSGRRGSRDAWQRWASNGEREEEGWSAPAGEVRLRRTLGEEMMVGGGSDMRGGVLIGRPVHARSHGGVCELRVSGPQSAAGLCSPPGHAFVLRRGDSEMKREGQPARAGSMWLA